MGTVTGPPKFVVWQKLAVSTTLMRIMIVRAVWQKLIVSVISITRSF